jgi:predicted enzyme related to lactoylglutathione lyase
MRVTETFFAVEARDKTRATAFYVAAFGASVSFASPGWTSLHVAGVRLGIVPSANHEPGPIGLHFAVDDLAAARAAVERAGGRVVVASTEVAPGVVLALVADTEGNELTLRGP